MTEKELNQIYLDRFINSMENDYEAWTMKHCAGPGMAWTEYHSPDYRNVIGRLSFGFSLCNSGAWVDGYFRWSLPVSVSNPFTKVFWRFRSAQRTMKSYLKDKEKREHLEKLNSVI
jgi:hypothetical protein